MALAEFIHGIAKFDVESVEGEISSAAAALKSFQEIRDESRREAEKTNVPVALTAAIEQQVRRAEFQLHEAQRRKTTVEATNVRTIEELKSEAEKAKGVERARKAIYDQAKSRWMSKLIW